MNEMRVDLIAPCGMNCRLCMAYQRKKNHCPGCRDDSDIEHKNKGCINCIIKNCPVIQSNETGFCFECDKIPCRRLKQLDKRYRTKYHMSMIENLEFIKQNGMDEFLKNQRAKWTCTECGTIVCVHKYACLICNTPSIKKPGL